MFHFTLSSFCRNKSLVPMIEGNERFGPIWASIRSAYDKEEACTRMTEFIELLIAVQAPTDKEKQAAWQTVDYVRSHSRFTAWARDLVQKMLTNASRASGILSSKQRQKVVGWLQSGQWVEESSSAADGGFWVPYDGPDDPDRYLGHGEFDTESGYYCE